VATERLVGTRDGRKYKIVRRVIGTGKREEILQIGLLGGQLHSGFLRLHMGLNRTIWDLPSCGSEGACWSWAALQLM
jgi:hypothetical protein